MDDITDMISDEVQMRVAAVADIGNSVEESKVRISQLEETLVASRATLSILETVTRGEDQ